MPSTDHYRVQIKHVQEENSKLTDQLLDLTDEVERLRVTNTELTYKLQEGGGRGGHYSSAAGMNDEVICNHWQHHVTKGPSASIYIPFYVLFTIN